jgi:hypothetical protein
MTSTGHLLDELIANDVRPTLEWIHASNNRRERRLYLLFVFGTVRGAKAMNAHPQEPFHDYDVFNCVGIEV